MGSNEEDEWEKLNLDSLQLNQRPPQDTRQPLPPQPNDAYRPSPPIPTYDENTIDQALLDALNNPRERMTLLRFEQVLYGFVKSRDAYMEFPAVQNSYQRLIAYRVAQRFRLEHAFAEGNYESGEARISFFKTPHTYIPSLLLYDVSKQIAAAEAVANPTSAAPVKMMKRAQKTSASKTSVSNAAPVVTCAEKEKQYAEARARIFGNDATTSTPPPTAPSLNTPNAAPPAPKTSPISPTSELRKGHISSATATAAISAAPPSERHGTTTPSPPITTEDVAPPQGQQNNKGKKVNVEDWKAKKAIVRDKNSEMYDPDFTRHASPVIPTAMPMPPPNYGYNNNYYPPDPYNYQYYPCEPQNGMYYPPPPQARAAPPRAPPADYNSDFPPLA